jgi:hypothetical protein
MRKMKLAFQQPRRTGQYGEAMRSRRALIPPLSAAILMMCPIPTLISYKRRKTGCFLKKGFGIGRTLLHWRPHCGSITSSHPPFEVKQFDMVDENQSDHIMLVTDLLLKK